METSTMKTGMTINLRAHLKGGGALCFKGSKKKYATEQAEAEKKRKEEEEKQLSCMLLWKILLHFFFVGWVHWVLSGISFLRMG